MRRGALGPVLVRLGRLALRIERTTGFAKCGVVIGNGVLRLLVFQLLDAVLGAIGI